ncbi:MAG: cysteine desulfurase family protein [Nanoarchaeota archaeon]
MKIIYLDNAATTPVKEEVVEEMKKYMLEEYGNAGSPHELGERAKKKIEEVRKKISLELGCKMYEIIFTSGASESNNIALIGYFKSNKGKKLLISKIEHSSVYETAKALEKEGVRVVEIPVNYNGLIDLEFIEKNAKKGDLVSVIHAHNEIGVIQDIGRIGKICRKVGAVFHTDSVQIFGKEKIKVNELWIDMLSASGHKINCIKGIGILFIKEGTKIGKIIYGGEQEKGIRPGTENVSGIVGMGKALELIKEVDKEKIRKNRDYFIAELEKIGGKIIGDKEKRIYNNINMAFSGIDSDKLVVYLSGKGIMCSARSACLTKERKENRILKALDVDKKLIKGSMRFVLDERIGKKEINYVVKNIKAFIDKIK